ncbi:hypothetical protein BGW36DRAFT_368694 [Talaromyces proteolyticus]|uniref:C2H2-type domain-containing protein n=1 Tax=Talaromyces proteolyticus TaxID=1131652 RepID=A0AAD4L6K0_9EURO|nr:uncharacterized protein BGW36DRAFT_368694 [Talaromyces proteolyticus]KAH8706066.1 hypothetical protein BGW36DRAFT_368694 [Talaromyces proteolyticus]
MSQLQPPPTGNNESDSDASLVKEEVCPECGRTFSGGGLKRHLRSHDPKQRNFPCDIDGCNRKGAQSFRRRDNLFQHQRRVHGGLSQMQQQQFRLRGASLDQSLSDQNLLSDIERTDGGSELDDVDMVEASQNPNSGKAFTTERGSAVANTLLLPSSPRLIVTEYDGKRVDAEQDEDLETDRRLRSLEMRVGQFEKRLRSLESWAFRSQDISR